MSETHLRALEFDAVNKKLVLTGFTLMQPIFLSESPYHLAFDLSSRRSRWVTPPSTSEIHISWPCGSKSKDDICDSCEKTSWEIPDTKDVWRTVWSYELVKTWEEVKRALNDIEENSLHCAHLLGRILYSISKSER